MEIPIYQVDAFTDRLFGGNPAAVCLFNEWPEDGLMQRIAAENNLAETAFLVKSSIGYEIRWFTPTVEVDLCGHATLASGYIVFNILGHHSNEVVFHSIRSGDLSVSKEENILTLNFPADTIKDMPPDKELLNALGIALTQGIFKGKTDYLVILETEKEVRELKPNINEIIKIDARGIIVSAPGDNVDFVSRFFAPQVGVPEDPVTGSAHTTLIPYWAERLNKTNLIAQQLSQRGGTLYCSNVGDRVKIGGKAVLYLKGELCFN